MTERPHTCHAEGCSAIIEPRKLFCSRHWKMTPIPLRRWIWATYVDGQEIRKDPTAEYLAAQRAAVEAVAQVEGRREPRLFPDFQTEVR